MYSRPYATEPENELDEHSQHVYIPALRHSFMDRMQKYRVFNGQADWTLTHTSHKDTEQSTIEACITLDGVTLTDPLIG
jgi:hypothetical protein